MVKKYLAVLTLSLAPLSVGASDLTYTPVNPSFGGNPLNSGHLLGTASAQREATASDADDDEFAAGLGDAGDAESRAEEFRRRLESRLLSQLSRQVSDSIFGDNPQDSGTFSFDGVTVNFETVGDSINVEISDDLDGTTTSIILPRFETIQ